MVRIISNSRGVFAIEVMLLIVPFILMVFMLLESFRREVFNVVMTHITCVEARGRALGESSLEIEIKTRDFLEASLGENLGKVFWKSSRLNLFKVSEPRQLNWLRLGKLPGGIAERWFRYEQFISFEVKKQKKHHQEIIERCLFPFS